MQDTGLRVGTPLFLALTKVLPLSLSRMCVQRYIDIFICCFLCSKKPVFLGILIYKRTRAHIYIYIHVYIYIYTYTYANIDTCI